MTSSVPAPGPTAPTSLARSLSLPPRLARLTFNPSLSTLVVTRLTPFHSQPNSPARRAPILTAEDPHQLADVKPRKTAAPRSTRCLQPLANRPSVCTTSLSGKNFTVYGFIQATLRTFLYLFCVTPFYTFLSYFSLLPSYVAASLSPSRLLSRT